MNTCACIKPQKEYRERNSMIVKRILDFKDKGFATCRKVHKFSLRFIIRIFVVGLFCDRDKNETR